MGLNEGTTQQMRVTMSHFEPESDGKFALERDIVFVGLFVVFMFFTAMLNIRVSRKIIEKGVKMNTSVKC